MYALFKIYRDVIKNPSPCIDLGFFVENPPIIVVPTHSLSPEKTGSQRPV
jgi:hypothetical protein